MSRYDILLQTSEPSTPPHDDGESDAPRPSMPETDSAKNSVNEPTERSTDHSTTESTAGPTHPSVGPPTALSLDRGANETVGRPKAFYITKRLDQRLDNAVRYFQDVWGIKKVDRSALVNAMLDNDSLWTDEALDQLADRLVRLLTSRLTG